MYVEYVWAFLNCILCMWGGGYRVGPVQRCAVFQSHPPMPGTATGVPESTTNPRDVVTQKLLKVQLIKIIHVSFIGGRLALENELLSSQSQLHFSISFFVLCFVFNSCFFSFSISNWLIFLGIEINFSAYHETFNVSDTFEWGKKFFYVSYDFIQFNFYVNWNNETENPKTETIFQILDRYFSIGSSV